MTPLHAAALQYAKQGLPIFPVVSGGKAPATEHGFKDATTDAERINAWYAAGDWNIGTSPGATGHAVIDLDDKNGKEGSRVWATLCAEPVETLTIGTPSGGRHLWFKGTVPSSAGKLGEGIDVRSQGGYVLLPPSVVDGKPYTAVQPGPCAPLPAWVADKLRIAERAKAKAPADVTVDPEGIEHWVIKVIAETIERDGAPVVGEALNDRTIRLGMVLGDGPEYGYAVSEDVACALVLEHWSNADRVADTIRNAYRSRENDLGCGPLGDPVRKYGPAEKWQPYIDAAGGAQRTAEDKTMGDGVGKSGRGKVRLRRGDTYAGGEDVEWVWPGWLARGMMHILSGEKATGKSTMSFSLLAVITVGGTWPDGTRAPLGDVLIWSGEDDIKKTIVPRLRAAGADMNRVFFPEVDDGAATRPFDPAFDMPGLLEAAEDMPDLQVIMVDPIVSASTADSHKNAETRRGLQPLVNFATARNIAVLGITHFTKNTQGRNAVDRVTGSLAYAAMARILWAAVKGENETDPRRLVRTSSNLGVTGGGFEYTLERVPVAGLRQPAQRVAWGKVLHGSVSALMGDGEDQSKVDKATEFLTTTLTDAGNAGVQVKELKAAAEAHSISWRTIERAKAKMPRIQPVKNLGHAHAPHSWVLLPLAS